MPEFMWSWQIVEGKLTDWDKQAIHDVNKQRYAEGNLS